MTAVGTATGMAIGIGGAALGGSEAAYDPGMMTFDGSTGYYGLQSLAPTGNKITAVMRFWRRPQRLRSDTILRSGKRSRHCRLSIQVNNGG
jgi:hypothetical protein